MDIRPPSDGQLWGENVDGSFTGLVGLWGERGSAGRGVLRGCTFIKLEKIGRFGPLSPLLENVRK